METPERNQYNALDIGLLIFKCKYSTLTREEDNILTDWQKLPENENNLELIEKYAQVFEKAKARGWIAI